MKAIGNDCKISAVCGLGGIGKTSLVVEHTWRQKQVYEGGVLWVSGENEEAFQLSVCDLARRLGLDEKKEEKFQDTLLKTLDWLQRREQRFCLVVDNMDEMKLSQDMKRIFIGSWRRETRGHIVVTSRHEPVEVSEEVGVKKDQCIELQKLTEREGLEFLKKRTELTSDEDSTISKLVGELGGLPLALEQATAYIRCSRCSFSSYLERYKEERSTLLKKRTAALLVDYTSPERLAMHTTWSLNFEYVSRMSKDFGLGQAVTFVMEMSAYLAPDNIPFSIINEGLPAVENDDLRKCASGTSGVTEILSVLTRFSLFQRQTANSYSVHRLVQEVIRDRMANERVAKVLGSAVRMLHLSFSRTTSPLKVCTELQEAAVLARETYPSLELWGRLARHACALQEHILGCAKHEVRGVIYTEEAVRIFSEASVYLGVSRETAKALELQQKKLEFLIQLETPPPDERIEVLKSLHIPLKDREVRLISQCMKQSESSEGVGATNEAHEGDLQVLRLPPVKAEELRLLGNQAVQEKDYQKALGLYTQAIEKSASDHRLFSNRALCYLKLDRPEEALEDCDRCLQLSLLFTKALMRKAWALHELVKKEAQRLKNRAQAVADLAVCVNKNLAKELTMFRTFLPCLVRESHHLTEMLYISAPGTTLLLEEGDYNLSSFCIQKDLQIIGLGAGAILRCTTSCTVVDSTCYFENITFPKDSPSVACANGAVVSFFGCNLSGGSSSCKDYPECNGGPGCIAVSKGKEKPCDRTGKYGSETKSGIGGHVGVAVGCESTGYIANCTVSHCGGGGVLSVHKGSVTYVNKCEVLKNHQAGLEARDGGKLIATSNRVYDNGCHGILVGANAGSCKIRRNKIFENSREGMLVVDTAEEVTVEDNDIYHNAPFGLSLDHSNLVISRNRIFENGFWGILTKSKTNAYITENDIFSNKCGGIFVGVNYSGCIQVDSNVVRDHTGPWLHHEEVKELLLRGDHSPAEMEALGIPPGETKYWSRPPIIGPKNELSNNEEKVRHPRKKLQSSPKECAYCHRPVSDAKLYHCSKCNIAAYCSEECQTMGSRKHKALCAIVASQYSLSVEVDPFVGSGSMSVQLHFSSPKLKGTGEGPRPDPNSHERFIVKIQTNQLNCHPLQLLTVYDHSRGAVIDHIQSPKVFNVVLECGVLGTLNYFTSKKAYFWAAFAESGKTITIFLSDLPPLQEW